MMPKGLFSQLMLLILAVGIVFLYIRPQFAYISDTQDLIAVYQEERKKIVTVNARLFDLTEKVDSVSAINRNRLFRYIPDTVDPILVQRDIKAMIESSGAIYAGVMYQEANDRSETVISDASGVTNTTKPYSFSFTAEGTYEQLKALLAILEKNDYPLEIQSLTLSPLEGGFISFDATVFTYGLKNESKVDEFEF